MKLHQRSILITFSGIDGTGKSTQASLLAERLAEHGIKSLVTHQPYYQYPKIVEDNGFVKIHPRAELFLFSADRAQHVHQIVLPALRNNLVVICDRWSHCTKAYQGYGHFCDLQQIDNINQIANQGLDPDISFLLTASIKTTQQRLQARGSLTPTEQLGEEFFKRVQDGYVEQFFDGSFKLEKSWSVTTDIESKEQNADFIFDKVSALLG